MTRQVDRLASSGTIGGRTVQITETGDVECARYPVPRAADGQVLIRTIRSGISPGTEMTFIGKDATNVYLHKTWNRRLRLFREGRPTLSYPVILGYRASGEVVESRLPELAVGTRIFGSWRHTEYTVRDRKIVKQVLPDALSHDDGIDIAQMGPICLNAVAYADGAHAGSATVVFGAGPVGLITAQVARATGASVVYVVDRLPNRLSAAAHLGFTPVEASADRDVAYELKKDLGARRVPVAFECTGSTHALNQAIRVVRRGGRVVAAGFYQGEASGLFLGNEFHHNGVAVVSGQIGNIHPGWNWAKLRHRTIELALNGQLVLGGLPRLTLPVDRAAEGFAALRRPAEVLQVVLAYD